jgi:RNA 2',3'-cyclic 3'-phosphodiesterase
MRHDPFIITLNKIVYGPNAKLPRMVWVESAKNQEMQNLQKDLENSLPVEREKENRLFAPHVTMARLKQMEFKALEIEERPIIDENISLSFEVKTIDVMESDLKRAGPEYEIIESFTLE